MLQANFFDRDPIVVAKDLLGKVLRVKYKNTWLATSIIETEAYYIHDKGSHASLGFTQKRKALFMPAGTIYMYYARGGDSLNISCHGEGNAVLIKSAYPYFGEKNSERMLQTMQQLNPQKNLNIRPIEKLCSGQTLLCKSLGLKVTEWNQKTFSPRHFYMEDVGYSPAKIIQTTRMGIPEGRDHHLLYRFIDYAKASFCTQNPLTKRNWQLGKDYYILNL